MQELATEWYYTSLENLKRHGAMLRVIFCQVSVKDIILWWNTLLRCKIAWVTRAKDKLCWTLARDLWDWKGKETTSFCTATEDYSTPEINVVGSAAPQRAVLPVQYICAIYLPKTSRRKSMLGDKPCWHIKPTLAYVEERPLVQKEDQSEQSSWTRPFPIWTAKSVSQMLISTLNVINLVIATLAHYQWIVLWEVIMLFNIEPSSQYHVSILVVIPLIKSILHHYLPDILNSSHPTSQLDMTTLELKLWIILCVLWSTLLGNCPYEPLGKYLHMVAGVRNRLTGKQSSEPVH